MSCPTCAGDGYLNPGDVCPDCQGTGVLEAVAWKVGADMTPAEVAAAIVHERACQVAGYTRCFREGIHWSDGFDVAHRLAIELAALQGPRWAELRAAIDAGEEAYDRLSGALALAREALPAPAERQLHEACGGSGCRGCKMSGWEP